VECFVKGVKKKNYVWLCQGGGAVVGQRGVASGGYFVGDLGTVARGRQGGKKRFCPVRDPSRRVK